MRVIVITGPTATGKTNLSINIAKKYNGEIINADSTQVYIGADIATEKITKNEEQDIKHHLFSFVNITDNYTVYDYQKDCRKCIEEIMMRNKTPIIVGGSGLYIKAALYNYEFTKNNIIFDDSGLSNEDLYKALIKYDKNTKIHQNNRKSVINSIKYYLNTNKEQSNKTKSTELLYDVIFLGLNTNRKELYNKINTRVDKMVKMGLIEEAKGMYTNIYKKNKSAIAFKTIIGYKELVPYFEKTDTLENCIVKIKQASRNYAKKQMTWFNNQMEINWFETQYEDFNKTIKEVNEYINNVGGNKDECFF